MTANLCHAPWLPKHFAAAIFALVLTGHSVQANAFEAFGFRSGMSKSVVDSAAKSLTLGIGKWFGESLIVQAQDAEHHNFLFNFCDDQLYSVSQTFPANFENMAGFVDDSIRRFGQPIFVSALGAVGSHGFVRPINIFWKMGETDYLRLMQFGDQYSLIYENKNSCATVPG